MAAIVPSSNEMASPFVDVEGCFYKAVKTLVQVSSHDGVGFLSSDIFFVKVSNQPLNELRKISHSCMA